jgi:hypothetical protein
MTNKNAIWFRSEDGTCFVNIYGKDEQGTVRRETIADCLTRRQAVALTEMVNRLGDRFLPDW